MKGYLFSWAGGLMATIMILIILVSHEKQNTTVEEAGNIDYFLLFSVTCPPFINSGTFMFVETAILAWGNLYRNNFIGNDTSNQHIDSGSPGINFVEIVLTEVY